MLKFDALYPKDALVIYERIIGDYNELREKWVGFLEVYKNYVQADALMMERFYDDPAIASLHRCICDLCITVEASCELENLTVIKGGKFAAHRFEGNISELFPTLQGIFNVWLPQSGFEMKERYGFNIYRSIDWANGTVVMDLYISIQ